MRRACAECGEILHRTNSMAFCCVACEEEYRDEAKKQEKVVSDWFAIQDILIPEKLTPDTMTGLAMTKHFINTPAEERV